MLTLFTQPTILKQIGPIRLAKFFEGFAEELKANNILLPTMDMRRMRWRSEGRRDYDDEDDDEDERAERDKA